MNPWVNTQAWNLKHAIESQNAEQIIGQQTQELVRALGGLADVSQMSPGAAALYIVALVLSQPEA